MFVMHVFNDANEWEMCNIVFHTRSEAERHYEDEMGGDAVWNGYELTTVKHARDKKDYVCINDANMGQWLLRVYDVCKETNNKYTFEGCDRVVCVNNGKVYTDEETIVKLCTFALFESYEEQNINAQCRALYEDWMDEFVR